ncbi:SET domain-containing protein-lysine N-methyltransferase [Candidatus Bathyarchaeota archaeon]|nr:SET domain-containing protein-lysine N-methyltransferase [Candidatus Bathyarchaeota archaeon]
MVQYDEEGIKHFYFMSLTKNEFVDATKKGGLGRFCNHSCAPNCYVDKWIVGDKLRMGIFVLRSIRAGEELTFNYNVDRYGADPQPCYCGEPECVGYIGGKTQTGRATKLPLMVIEALGIDDGEDWATGVSRKFRKKRSDEDDEQYTNALEPKSLSVDGVKNVMACLFQVKEKWIIVKVLERIQRIEDVDVLAKVVQLHVYKIMKLLLKMWAEDDNVLLQVLEVLAMLPRLTKNKIVDSGIEDPVRDLMESEGPRISDASTKLIRDWDALELGYRIRRRKAEPGNPRTATAGALRSAVFGGDRDPEPSTPKSKPVSPLPNGVEIPKGPKSSIPQRNLLAASQGRRFVPPHPVTPRNRFGQDKRTEDPLPAGWFQGTSNVGAPYYFNEAGVTTWQRPKAPTDLTLTSSQVEAQVIQKIIDDANKAPTKASPRPEAAGSSEMRGQEASTEKWRALPMDKQMKIYENTVSDGDLDV